MILQKLKIENYKRLKSVDIEFPSIGIIGVVGQNGAGKSSLFEAILWALFPPRLIGIDQRDVVPRKGNGGATKVELTVETADATYTISRVLRMTRGGSPRPEASVYRGEEEHPIVTGADAVSDFVRTTMLRMSPTSFTTTFFTKQKELAFFGAVGDTERRREMQRLLDLDAIEKAQGKLRVTRNEARGVFDARRHQYEQESHSRDLDAELAEARATEAEAQGQLQSLDTALASLTARYEAAEAERDALLVMQQRHDTLTNERSRAEVRRDTARAAIADAERRLIALAQRAERADTLAPDLATLPAVEAALQAAEAAKAHAERVAEQTNHVREGERRQAQLTTDTDALVSDLDALGDFLFTWGELAEAAPGLARARALAGALSSTAPLAIARAAERETWTTIRRFAEQAQQHADEAKARLNAIAQIDARLALATAGGDPAPAVEAREKQERRLGEEIARGEAELQGLRAERQKFTTLLERWQNAEPDVPCPTCGRPFSEDDAPIVLASLHRSVIDCDTRGKDLKARIEETRTESRAVSGELGKERERLAQTQQYAAQRKTTVDEEAKARARAEASQQTLADALTAAGRRRPPKEDEFTELEQELTLLQKAANSAPQAARLAANLERVGAMLDTERDKLAALGPAAYDVAAHTTAQREQLRLIALRAEAEAIAEQLRARPAELTRRETAETDAAQSETVIANLTAQLAALAFDPNRLIGAQGEVSTLAGQANEVQTQLGDARVALTRAEAVMTGIARERDKLAVLKADVDTLGGTVDRYDRMDKGFTDFSLALAARIQPKLGDYASDLIELMTNGRYARLVFDQNYTPALYDGDLERFPIEKFSGGERDVAALAARIALSQLLAARGGHTIGFMVLDEVFGSLDGERRTLVLDALATMRDVIPQLFIISHVDDVRHSPVMDEVWTVAAQPDGTSQVIRRNPTDLLGGLGGGIAAR